MVDRSVVAGLQEQVVRMQGRPAGGQPVATHPALAGLLTLRAGGVYEVGAASLVALLLAGPSREGVWCAVVGSSDLGLEAATAAGVELSRLILVPDPGPDWLEVTAALVDVVGVVVVRAPARVGQRDAARLAARLRTRQTVLVAWGSWPRSDARLRLTQACWTGVGEGHGRLTARRVTLEVQRGTAPARRRELWFPASDHGIRPAEPAPVAEPMRVVS